MSFDISNISDKIVNAGIDAFGDVFKSTKDAIKKFLEEHKADLENWTTLYVNKEITKDEFETLVRGLVNTAKIEGLRVVFQAQVRGQEKVEQIIIFIIETLIKIIIASL
jgi:hypothetical protein